jgi:hypothetical protein
LTQFGPVYAYENSRFEPVGLCLNQAFEAGAFGQTARNPHH